MKALVPPSSWTLVRKRTTFPLRWAQISKCPHFSKLISMMAQNTKPGCSNYPLCSKKTEMKKIGFWNFHSSLPFLGQTNPHSPPDSWERLFTLTAPEAVLLYPSIFLSLPLQCRYLFAVPDPRRHHPTALKVFLLSSMCSCFPREREIFWRRRKQSQKEVLWLAIQLTSFRVSKAYSMYRLQTC